jgi:hypothetical protein
VKKLFLLIFIGILAFVMQGFLKKQQIADINSFDECVSAGFPILTSYPASCMTSNGRSFQQDTGNELAMSNLIVVSNPRSNQKISNPVQVTGKARGSWFFEASFSMELFSANNKSLGTAKARAQGDWMSEGFVPFTSDLNFSFPDTKTGKLVISNANPSGLEQNHKELIIPVTF